MLALFMDASSDRNFLFDRQVLERLWRERELAQNLPADGTWRWPKGEKPINAGLTPETEGVR